MALLALPFLASCGRPPAGSPPAKPPPAAPTGAIKFQGLDNNYRGTTTILPDDRVVHQKDPP